MLFIYQFLAGLLGMLLHSAVKVTSLNRITPKDVGIGFILRTYFREDFPSLILSILSIVVQIISYRVYMSLDPITDKIPFISLQYQVTVQKIHILLFIATTYMIESIVMAFTGASEKWLRKFVHENE